MPTKRQTEPRESLGMAEAYLPEDRARRIVNAALRNPDAPPTLKAWLRELRREGKEPSVVFLGDATSDDVQQALWTERWRTR